MTPVASVDAATLGKIQVNSHIGEPFFAEVPLKPEAGEQIASLVVNIAGKGDYRIFEVYRDDVLDSLRTDVVSDQRGIRVVLSSKSAMNTPFFNLVLKNKQGRVSSFRKYPIFLDVGKAVVEAASRPAVPAVPSIKQSASSSSSASVQQTIVPEALQQASADQWARASVYGPTVRGDSLWTIANRLRKDRRFDLNQVMVALFESNSGAFDKANINLLKAGSKLRTPAADVVAKYSPGEAARIFKQQENAWKKLQVQPHYAAEKEVQRHRYSSRVSVGNQATGSAPDAAATSKQNEQSDAVKLPAVEAVPAASSTTTAPADRAVAATGSATDAAMSRTNKLLAQVQQSNVELQQRLEQDRENMKALASKLDNLAIASSQARIDKLEVLIARLQNQLEKQQQAPAAVASPVNPMDWVVWLLAALVLLLIAVVVVLLRREPAHPADAGGVMQPDVEPRSELMPADTPEVAAVSDGASDETDALAAAIENEFSGIENDETGHPAIDSLVGELSDTDTVELESFYSADQDGDPDTDYVSEAEIYIRYGMDDEALQQLDIALRMQPDNGLAHSKKVELLHAAHDTQKRDVAIRAARAGLSGAALAGFESSLALLGDSNLTVDLPAEPTLPADQPAVAVRAEGTAVAGAGQMSADFMTTPEEADALFDFDDDDFDGLDLASINSGQSGQNKIAMPASEGNVSDDIFVQELPAVADSSALSEKSADQVTSADVPPAATEELDWLFDESFDDQPMKAAVHGEASETPELQSEMVIADEDDGLVGLEHLLEQDLLIADERPAPAHDASVDGEQHSPREIETMVLDETVVDQADIDAFYAATATADDEPTLELDATEGLFFSLDDAAETAQPAASDDSVHELDQLLDAFDQDDELLIELEGDQAKAGSLPDVKATDLELSFFDGEADVADEEAKLDDMLGGLLNEFAEESSQNPVETDLDAMLGGLLDEFSDTSSDANNATGRDSSDKGNKKS